MMNKILFRILTRSILGRHLSDKLYLLLLYKIKIGRRLNLQNPQAFTEKIQWLKLNWRREILTRCADKYEVREFVKERIGPDVLKELYGVYDRPEGIDISKLPDTFVLKVNHGCSQNIFCRHKSEFDWKRSLRRLKKHFKDNLYLTYREWAYKNIVPRIICEEYLTGNGEALYEYGFYCYDGVPRLVEINEEQNGLKRVNMFDINLNLLENKYCNPALSEPVARTTQFDRMLEYAVLLSRGFPFVRVDLMCVNGRIYFGEMTFYPLAGILKLTPESFDFFLGSFLQLPGAKV